MAIHDLTGGVAGVPCDGIDRLYRLANRLDFSRHNVLNGDTVCALDVKAGTKIARLYTKLVTPEGSAATATAGDNANTAGWDASVDLNASVGVLTQTVTTDAYGADGKLYAADDTIDLVVAANLGNAVIEVYAECLDLG
jgi:hypothetical protein